MCHRHWTLRIGSAAAAALLACSAQANLVTNGGFETGNFSGWTLSGSTASYVDVDNVAPHSGTYGSYWGPVGTPGILSQTLSTVAGVTYDIEFWLSNESDGTNQFEFNWDGGALEVSIVNSPATPYTSYQFSLAASSSMTDISFSFVNDSSFWDLDDVSVEAQAQAVPEPSSLALVAAVLLVAGWGSRSRSAGRHRR